jgi:glycosyltransferase involved in cell wall biosynthesis
MESLACGTPVLATRVGGIPEIVVSPELGVLVEPNQEDIAAGLHLVLSKQWDRAMLREHARTRDWNHVANDFQIFLEKMDVRTRWAT